MCICTCVDGTNGLLINGPLSSSEIKFETNKASDIAYLTGDIPKRKVSRYGMLTCNARVTRRGFESVSTSHRTRPPVDFTWCNEPPKDDPGKLGLISQISYQMVEHSSAGLSSLDPLSTFPIYQQDYQGRIKYT